MEETTFDQLLKNAARQTSRRKALGALIGGALVLNRQGESEANKKAKRRRDRKRRQYRRRVSDPFLSPIKVKVVNPGPASVNMQFVGLDAQIFVWDCVPIGGQTLHAGGEAQYATNKPVTDGFVWINETYAIELWNPFLRTPAYSAAVNGLSIKNTRRCPRRGTRAVLEKPISAGQTVKFRIYDKEFTLTRYADTNYKEFTLTLPTNL